MAFFENSRGGVTLAAFLATDFLVAAFFAAGLAALAFLLALGAAFLAVAFLVVLAACGVTGAPGVAAAVVVSVVAFIVVPFVRRFGRTT